MNRTPVIAIFDIGKTNKKLFLFNEDYHIVYEKSARFNEVTDEDGFACENLEALRSSLFESLREVFKLEQYDIRAINFSTYGASFVYIGENGEPLTPLYNYLKPFPEKLQEDFYAQYGDKNEFSRQTASPALGSLNSGLQLYRLKHEQPEVFSKVKYALHLPQYMSYLLTQKAVSDITSIGCHTALWDFDHQQYHAWVEAQGIFEKLAPTNVADCTTQVSYEGHTLAVGCGLHDSSAALIPYLANFHEPFMLLSTGTWCISLNPFNHNPLTAEELEADCLCYLDYRGNPVKASRLFSGYEHEVQTKRLAEYFNTGPARYKSIAFDSAIIPALKKNPLLVKDGDLLPFAEVDLTAFNNDTEAYHHLIYDLVRKQVISSNLVLKGTAVRRIFVDGGFSKNLVFMNMLAAAFEDLEIFAASMPQATSLGAAIALHKHWNHKSLPTNLIELKYYLSNPAYSPTKI
ncbi:FGGY family carbohydrate kinase [Mucilaginibacter sp. RS28]|uniref:FGGY family carbohydrate kinase n=1 Tax=Mucilaginibacter straminoryzae TaxID=2932774 RepID=A0A9X1X1S4_9SPHI|nr:FGGY family carbohydrate kinase [Mucilaginibacter straminoryzae]MCJ8209261.1 FGGY family carbohydrate kinase [Mucilaginibacter straminoryzae]